jgi:Pex2 / Pex12 amino terminal region
MRVLACRETHLAAGVLYYALTTGAGLQTLGEEYCDLLQITGLAADAFGPKYACTGSHAVENHKTHVVAVFSDTGGMPMEPSAARRAVLVALQSVAPYCLARWAPVPADREDGSTSWQNDSPAVSPTATALQQAGGLQPLPHQRLWQQVSTLLILS